MQRYNKKADFSKILSISGYMWLYLVINQDEVGKRLGLTKNYVKYIPMFRDYIEMTRQKHKKTYIYQHLADKYEISSDYAKHVIIKMLNVVCV